MFRKFRKILHKFGLDFHRYKPAPDRMGWFKTLKIKTVLDVGANVGQFAKEARMALPEAFIYSFEPLIDCFDRLNEAMKGDPRFKSFNFALGEKEETTNINKSNYSPSSSILEMSIVHKELFPHTAKNNPEKIYVRKLDEVKELSLTHLEKEILLKIDTQGYEDKVLKGAEKLLPYIKAVLVETSFVELYERQPLFNDIYNMLKEKGFSYKGAIQQKIGRHGEVISEDSIFIRDTKNGNSNQYI